MHLTLLSYLLELRSTYLSTIREDGEIFFEELYGHFLHNLWAYTPPYTLWAYLGSKTCKFTFTFTLGIAYFTLFIYLFIQFKFLVFDGDAFFTSVRSCCQLKYF